MTQNIIPLKYGNTNTFLLQGTFGSLLLDTDYAGTMPSFCRVLKAKGIHISDIDCVVATHFHPDHCGLIGRLQEQGIRLLLAESQVDSIHFPDYIFARDHLAYTPVDLKRASVITFSESRMFLERLGIAGTILSTPSHSADSVSLILDNGHCFVGDMEPMEFIPAYEEGCALQRDWEALMAYHPSVIHYGHAPESVIERK